MAHAADRGHKPSTSDDNDDLLGEDAIRDWNPSEFEEEDNRDSVQDETPNESYMSLPPDDDHEGSIIIADVEDNVPGKQNEAVEASADAQAALSGGQLRDCDDDDEREGEQETVDGEHHQPILQDCDESVDEIDEEDPSDSWLNVDLPDATLSPGGGRDQDQPDDLGVTDSGRQNHESDRGAITAEPMLQMQNSNLTERGTLDQPQLTSASSLELTSLEESQISNRESGNAHRASTSPDKMSTPSSPSPVHPLPLQHIGSIPVPLSPSTSPYKRSNSLYLTPNITSSVLLKRKDFSTIPSSLRTPQLWDLDPARRSSRLLDEGKRKEIWHDFKRAEENVVSPPTKRLGSQDDCHVMHVDTRGRRDSSPSRIANGEALQERQESYKAPWKHSRENSGSGMSSPSGSRPKLDRRQTISSGGSFTSPLRKPTVVTAITAPLSLSPTSHSRSADTTASAHTVTRAEYDQVLKDSQSLQIEAENFRRTAMDDKETIRSLNERLKHLETLERENKFLKDETQKQLMQDLNAKESIKTLNDQLALRGKSEEQLKLQTKQLMEQNRSLQADLLDKIAGETDKIQKMARLSVEKQALAEELEQKEAIASDRKDTERRKARRRVLLRIVKRKHRVILLSAVLRWKINAREIAAACAKIFSVFVGVARRTELQRKGSAFRQLQVFAMAADAKHAVDELRGDISRLSKSSDADRFAHGAARLAAILTQRRERQLATAFRSIHRHAEAKRKHLHCLELGLSKLHLVLHGSAKAALRHSWNKWDIATRSLNLSTRCERSQEAEDHLAEAKECIFSLSRAKTKLEEKLQTSRDESERLSHQAADSIAELRLAKHGYVASVVREVERAWLREFFVAWRIHTDVSICSKQLRLQVQMADLRAAEREKHAQSLDDYTRVLKSDLERVQFFSQDKRVAVDVLTKKLSRVQDRYKEMEERHMILEERAHMLKGQLVAFVEWDGVALPFAMLVLCKDIAVGNLRELFELHATSPAMPGGSIPPSSAASSMILPSTSSSSSMLTSSEFGSNLISRAGGEEDAVAPRLSVDALVRLLEYSTVLEEKLVKREDLRDRLLRHLPRYAIERGLLFHDFLMCLDHFLADVLPPNDRKYEQAKQFWSSLLSLMGASRNDGSSQSVNGGSSGAGRGSERGSIVLYPPRTSWVGRLSDDILQNQEKLLAVLEHETAVVERAVMEKSSLKHAYPPPIEERTSGSGDTGSTFLEYQCDPVLPPDPTPGRSRVAASSSASPLSVGSTVSNVSMAMSSPAVSAVLEKYADWHLAPQIRDLFLACHRPLLQILVQYSHARRDPRHGDQFCLDRSAVGRMLEDMKLSPAFLAPTTIDRLFANFRAPEDELLLPQGFALFLGACALELYAQELASGRSRRPYELSPREVLLSFFGDLGLLVESDVPPPERLCFVGMDVEGILWPLFEYYAGSDNQRSASEPLREDVRVGMTASAFTAFMAEIAGGGAAATSIFDRVKRDAVQRRQRASDAQSDGRGDGEWVMHADDFYVALAIVQSERTSGAAYASPGEAVRHWMQQTQ